ncbi:MAG TPA: PE family protein, partial [Mycobacterium sp.]|nr:PE family protein [Mycobacterium sp.]
MPYHPSRRRRQCHRCRPSRRHCRRYPTDRSCPIRRRRHCRRYRRGRRYPQSPTRYCRQRRQRRQRRQ